MEVEKRISNGSYGARDDVADEVLLDLIKEGDEAAMSMFYKRKSRLVYSLALNIVREVADAEEITGDVFLKIWQNAGGFDRSRGSVMAWITTIARRQAIDKTRSKGFKGRTMEQSLEAVGNGGDGYLADDARRSDAASGLQNREIEDALGQLNETHRELIRLSYYQGLSHSMIAEALNTPLGTVKTRIREAVSQLRGILNVRA